MEWQNLEEKLTADLSSLDFKCQEIDACIPMITNPKVGGD